MDAISSITNIEESSQRTEDLSVDEDSELHESTIETKRQQPTEVATETVTTTFQESPSSGYQHGQ